MSEQFDFILFADQMLVAWSTLAVFLLVAFFSIFIILLVSRKKTRKIAAGLLAVMLGMFVFSWFSVRKVSTSYPVEASATREIRVSPPTGRVNQQQLDGLNWPPMEKMSSEELFLASPYKFRGSAVRGLARQCGTYLLEKNLKDLTSLSIGSFLVPPEEIDLTEKNQLLSDRIEFIDELSKQLPPRVTISDQEKEELGENEISIALDFSTSSAKRNYHHFPGVAPLYRDGTFTAEVFTGKSKSDRFRTQFQQLEWVTNFSNFNQNCDNRFIHVSAEWKPTEFEAQSAAIRKAAKALAPPLMEQIDRTLSSNGWRRKAISRSDAERRLGEHLRRSINNGQITEGSAAVVMDSNTGQRSPVVDRFTQVLQVEDGMGSYREELLLYPHGFEPIISAIASEHQQQRQSVLFRFLSLAGLVGVVLITYFSANAATRGYAVVSIGAICVLIFVSGLVLITLVS